MCVCVCVGGGEVEGGSGGGVKGVEREGDSMGKAVREGECGEGATIPGARAQLCTPCDVTLTRPTMLL